MSTPYIGEIIMFGGNFAPRSWAFCDGQTLPISQNTALFSILGTTYGGDGRTTLGIPNFQSRSPVHAGTGPGLANRGLGAKLGTETNTLTTATMGGHTHGVSYAAPVEIGQGANSGAGTSADPSGHYPAGSVNEDLYGAAGANSMSAPTATAATTVNNAGNQQPFNNIQPYLVVNFIICIEGTFPSRA